MTDLFVTSLSGASARQAVVEQSGSSAWLFMTGPNGEKPIADCFLYNNGGQAIPPVRTGRIACPPTDNGPPALDERYASDEQVLLPVTEDDVQIIWSPAGDAVAVRIHGHVAGFISPDDLQGYSRAVKIDCQWAHPFDEELYLGLFGAER
jgi:hypothetical protein